MRNAFPVHSHRLFLISSSAVGLFVLAHVKVSHFQLNLASFDRAKEFYWRLLSACTSRRTLPQCGQPGSDNRPHTSNSTQDHWIHNQPSSSIPIIPPTSTFTSKFPLSASSSSINIANDSSAQNSVPGLLKPRSKLHIG
ncbi:unnamed protein product, partial [Schistosoma margrebowiei]